jgi:maltooligosyltrehalose trehalohydrolase
VQHRTPIPGAFFDGHGGRPGCQFVVWAPLAERVELHSVSPKEQRFPLQRLDRGYFETTIQAAEPGMRYFYRLDDGDPLPDPASRLQPQGVHGPSEVTNREFHWTDAGWHNFPLDRYIIYELHVGTFTPGGTFDAVASELDYLKALGITAVELMPISQFPGSRNWGYDGVFPYAVQNSYCGPAGLKRLVNACHERGLAVILDVVYNHIGPEGNYLEQFGPYFTDRYKTPWGKAINFDGPDSDEVRRFFIENALYWITEFHIDALRLDAVHAILDTSAYPILEEITDRVHRRAALLNRVVYVIAESDLNDPRLIRSRDVGGSGIDAQWSDDFHHSLHTTLTDERHGYYADFEGFRHLAAAYTNGFVYAGQYSVSRKRSHGRSSSSVPASTLIVYTKNHDQIGNRMKGERFSHLLGFPQLKLAAASLLLSPYIPLIFMGDEYGETAPFQYFVSHSDPMLIEAVRKGRKQEFAAFHWDGEPPDPQSEQTFRSSVLSQSLRHSGHHQMLWNFYRDLIQLRQTCAPLAQLSKDQMEVFSQESAKLLCVRRWYEREQVFVLLNFNSTDSTVPSDLLRGDWRVLLDSEGSVSGVISEGAALTLKPFSAMVLALI